MINITKIKQKIFNLDTILKIGILLFSPLLLIMVRGYSYPNYAGIIPSMQYMSNPTLFKGDWYIQSFTIYHYQFKIFFNFLTKITSISIFNLFFCGYILTIFLFIFSAFKLSKNLFNDKTVFLIFFILILVCPLNGIENNKLLHLNIFQPVFMAVPLCILAINYLFENKTIKAYLFAGIITCIHFTVGINMFIVFIFFNMLDATKRFNLAFYKKMFFSVIAYIIIAGNILAQAILYHLQNATPTSKNNLVSFIDFAKFRVPHHYILSSNPLLLTQFFIIIFLGIIGFWQKNKKKLGDKDKKLALFVGIMFAFIFIQFIFIEIMPNNLIAQFHFYRITIFITLFAILYFAYFLKYHLVDIINTLKINKRFIYVIIFSVLFLIITTKEHGKINVNLKYDSEVGQLYCWIKQNTPADALFVKPIKLSGFHLYAQRKEVVNFYDTPLYSNKDITEWKKRLEDITKIKNIFAIKPSGFPSIPFLEQKYNELNDLDFQNLKKKYGLNYAIVYKEKKLNFNKVYQNNSYSVYKIE